MKTKKLLTLLTLLLCMCSGAWAQTDETPGNTGSADTDLSGTSYTIPGTFIAGAGSTKVSPMESKGVKVRLTKTYKLGENNLANVLVILVKENYIINGITIYGITNDNTKTSSVTSIKVDGVEQLSASVTIPNRNATTAATICNLSGLTATKQIVLQFGSGASQGNFDFHFSYSEVPAAPTITTQPIGASYVTGDPIAALTVEAVASAGDLSYQWYKCDDANKTNASAIDDATSDSYTPNAAGFYFVRVTDSNGSVDSDVAEITVSAPTAPTINVSGAPAGDVLVGTEVTLTANVTGVPVPTVKWYQCDDAEKNNPVEKATGTTYNPSTANKGTYYFYATATNEAGSVASSVVTLTVTDPNKYVVGNAYYISVGEVAVNGEQIVCDNITAEITFGGSMNAGASDGTVSVLNDKYVAYIAGGNDVSNGWDVTFTPSVAGTLTAAVFINKNKTFTVTNVTTFMRQNYNETTATDNGSNSYNSDAGVFKGLITIDVVAGTSYKFSVAGSKMGFYGFEFTPTVVTITSAGYKAYNTIMDTDFKETENLTAYIVSEATATSVKLTAVDAVPANTPVILKGAAGDYTLKKAAATPDYVASSNLLKVSNGTVAGDGSTRYALANLSGIGFYLVGNGVTIPTNYIELTSGSTGAPSLSLDFGEGTTGISNVNVNHNDNQWYDLNGRKVENPTKGVYIMNGKKVIVK